MSIFCLIVIVIVYDGIVVVYVPKIGVRFFLIVRYSIYF